MARQVNIDSMFENKSNQYCNLEGRMSMFRGDKKSQSINEMHLMSVLAFEVKKAGLI